MVSLNTSVRTTGASEYRDCKSNVHTVKHSVIFSETDKRELEDKIVENLYRIFMKIE